MLLTAAAVWHRHTFLEGGVRVMSFISGPLVPAARRGTRWTGMAASADWYKTIVEGIAEGTVPANTGTRAPDALNLWPAILDGSAGPRQDCVLDVAANISGSDSTSDCTTSIESARSTSSPSWSGV